MKEYLREKRYSIFDLILMVTVANIVLGVLRWLL